MKKIFNGSLAVGALLAAAVMFPAHAAPITFASGADYDNSNPVQATGVFRDVLNGAGISRGNDLGGTGHTALNLAGSSNNGAYNGAMTLYDTTPGRRHVQEPVHREYFDLRRHPDQHLQQLERAGHPVPLQRGKRHGRAGAVGLQCRQYRQPGTAPGKPARRRKPEQVAGVDYLVGPDLAERLVPPRTGPHVLRAGLYRGGPGLQPRARDRSEQRHRHPDRRAAELQRLALRHHHGAV